jgi:hypothetical protein
MEEIGNKFLTIWSFSVQKSFLNRNEENTFISLNKFKILKDCSDEMEGYISEEFLNINENIYAIHLKLIEFCFDQINTKNRYESVIFLNMAFENWIKQQKNKKLKGSNTNGAHLSLKCCNSLCICSLENYLVLKAFDLIIHKLFILLPSFNRLYNFNQNFQIIEHYANEFLESGHSDFNKFKLLCELNNDTLFKNVKINYHEVDFILTKIYVKIT